LIDELGGELYGDFLEYYNVRLTTAIDELTPKEILVLVRQLPATSRTFSAKQGGPEFRGWDTNSYLLASVIDAINANTHAFVSANSKRKPKRPKQVTTPMDKKRKAEKPNLFAMTVKNKLDELKNPNIKRGGFGITKEV